MRTLLEFGALVSSEVTRTNFVLVLAALETRTNFSLLTVTSFSPAVLPCYEETTLKRRYKEQRRRGRSQQKLDIRR